MNEIANGYLKFLWALMALSSIVLIEPSPYDLLFIFLFCAALWKSYLIFPKQMLIPLFFLLIFTISNFISIFLVYKNSYITMRYFIITYYLILTWIYFIGISHKRKKVIDVILYGYLFSALLSVVVGTLAFFNLLPTPNPFLIFGRISSFFKDPNVYGPYLIPMALFSLFHFETNLKLKKLLWLVIFILLSVGILLSFSRAAWGNYFISVIIYFIFPLKGVGGKRILTLLTILIVTLPAIFFITNETQAGQLLLQRLHFQYYDTERFQIQLLALKHVIEHPVGIGPGQSEYAFNYSTHSLYVRLTIEYGILGFLSFLTFLLFTIIKSLRNSLKNTDLHNYSPILTAALIGVLFNSFFIDTLHWRHFWLILALQWITITEEDSNENRPDNYSFR